MADDELLSKPVVLGRTTYHVRELPFRTLRKVLPRMQRIGRAMQGNDVSEDVLADMLAIVALGVGVEAAELDELPIRPSQLREAIDALADVCALIEAEPGDPKPSAAASPGTISTLSSPPLPAGPGT